MQRTLFGCWNGSRRPKTNNKRPPRRLEHRDGKRPEKAKSHLMKKPNRIARKSDTARSRAQTKPARSAQRSDAVTTTLREAVDLPQITKRARRARTLMSGEWKLTTVRETPSPHAFYHKPEDMVDYWHASIATAPNFSPEVEWMAVVLLNTKLQVRGHVIVGQGSMNECTAHPREIFRAAIVGGAYAIVLMHNHPSGDSCPSEPDRRLTRRLAEVAALVQISLPDHVIVGTAGPDRRAYFSFAEAGLMDAYSQAATEPSPAPARPKKRRVNKAERAKKLAEEEARALAAGTDRKSIEAIKGVAAKVGVDPALMLAIDTESQLRQKMGTLAPGTPESCGGNAAGAACVAESPEDDEEETIMIEMPIELHDAVMDLCRKRGVTFSEFAREAVRERIQGADRVGRTNAEEV